MRSPYASTLPPGMRRVSECSLRPPRHHHLAKLVLAHEGIGSGLATERVAAAKRVYETLFESLAPVIGVRGVQSIFARSLKLVERDYEMVEIPPAESTDEAGLLWERVAVRLSALEPSAAATALTDLYGTFFGLLANFIGEPLVWRMVKKAFPAVNDIDLKKAP